MTDKYYRLVCFIVNICPEPLRELFIKFAKNDAGSSYSTLDSYLAVRHRDVIQLQSKRKIRDYQYALLYPGRGTADEKQWDVTLLVTLITELFASSLQPLDVFLLKNEICDIRNQLQHQTGTSNISDETFDNFWRRLDSAVMSLAKHACSAEHVDSIRKKIENAKCNNLPNLGDSLRLWYEERLKHMENKLNEVESNTKETTSILQQVTVQKPGPSGDKNKRIKTADVILAKLQASFESTMKDLSENFNEPEEVANIRTKLRDNHHVIVTGRYNSRYFEAALAAIKGMNYNTKRSVEMHISSDWRHIDPEDVDLVLCMNPFGSYSYDENKTKSMADIFNSMMHTTKGGEDKTLDIIMVTDLKILSECKQYHDHDILEEVVKVFDRTSETQPADLTFECGNQYTPSTRLSVANNLCVMTDNFLKQYRITSLQVDENVLKEARDKFKAKKVIVVTGPRKCGKTSLAVALASSYESSRCSLLTKANDFMKIDLQNICLILIDEFAGKYRYEENDVYRWYTMFDHLYSAVQAGQMNVVITCERTKLDKCCTEILQHPILEHRVVIPERTVVIKQEMMHLNTETGTNELLPITDKHQGVPSVTHIQTRIPDQQLHINKLTGPHVWSVKDGHKRHIRVNDDTINCNIYGSCILPSGEILLADYSNNRLKKLDDRYRVISVCDLPDSPHDVCYIGNNEAVVAGLFSRKLQFVDIRGGMTLTRSVDTDHVCVSLACHGNNLYVTDSRTVYLYSTDGALQRVLYSSGSSTPFDRIRVNNAGSMIYIIDGYGSLVTIDSSGNYQYTFTDSELSLASDVCIDGEGHVLMSSRGSKKILQLSSDGKQKLGIIENTPKSVNYIDTLCFDRKNKTLIVAGVSNHINVLKLH